MTGKPTLAELENRVRQLENEVAVRSQIESELREIESRFRMAFQTSPDSININRLSDGLFIDINEGFTALTGYECVKVRRIVGPFMFLPLGLRALVSPAFPVQQLAVLLEAPH